MGNSIFSKNYKLTSPYPVYPVARNRDPENPDVMSGVTQKDFDE